VTALIGANRAWIETLYAQYLESPSSVDPAWQAFFLEWNDGAMQARDVVKPPPIRRSIFGGRVASDSVGKALHTEKNSAVLQLISAYRRNGHLVANLDPLGLKARRELPQLTLQYHGLTEDDLDTVFHVGRLAGPSHRTLADIVDRCEQTYCAGLGAEFMYIRDEERRRWLESKIEESGGRLKLDRKTALRVLQKLTAADHFEAFIDTKFAYKKRFSIEGGEATIPLLDLLLTTAADLGVESAAIGMAHRGRLNVLANILGKAHGDIFEEFDDKFERPDYLGSGDVKYHLGYSGDVKTGAGRDLHVSLAFNPSHLEFVAPVVVGHVRGRQDHFGDSEHKKQLAVLIHGDAAIAGQGISFETIQLARLPGYTVGGSIHLVINNQIGFTTPVESARSSEHCTDVVKAILMPVLHVNAEDLGAVAFAARLAAEYRQRFGEDIILDLICYRKYGHNEGDEPTLTNPVMYSAVHKRKTPLQMYADSMIAQGVLTAADIEAASADFRAHLDAEFERARDPARAETELGGLWKGMHHTMMLPALEYQTGLERSKLTDLLLRTAQVPESFELHRKVARAVINKRQAMARGEAPLDWGAAETLAYASLLVENRPVRLSGQDAGRGTFAHRHAVLHDQKTGAPHIPLNHLGKQAPFDVYDSPLIEGAVVGFEFGYSLARPNALVVWEAQFGDFANGAQVLLDQFVSSSEAKWNRSSGLVLLLPHGYEGQGPEHSSARLERFLQMSGDDNWRVVNPTTPSQIFHLIRSQMLRSYRKPLVVMTPKSVLRHPKAVSSLDELAGGFFQPVIDDGAADPDAVQRVVLCSGKVYYDLLEGLEARAESRVAIIRVEQLYPLDAELTRILDRYTEAEEIVWCQEEPRNMGAFGEMLSQLIEMTGLPVRYAGRKRAAAPATGSPKIHKAEQAKLVAEALEF